MREGHFHFYFYFNLVCDGIIILDLLDMVTNFYKVIEAAKVGKELESK